MKNLVEVRNLKKYFYRSPNLFSYFSTARTQSNIVPAVDDVSFDIAPGEVVGLVGESGCGKTTLGRTILRLMDKTDGEVYINGEDIFSLSPKMLWQKRGEMQIVFQNPSAALNSQIRVRSIIEEALKIHTTLGREARRRRIYQLLEMVKLAKSKADRYPYELSGGEKRRVGFARILATNPRFIVADEPTSSLDVSIQLQIVNLMQELQREAGLTYLFISHDLRMVTYLSKTVIVMYLGKIVEKSLTKKMSLDKMLHPYSQQLLASSYAVSAKKQWRKSLPRHAKTSFFVDFDKVEDVFFTGCRFCPRCYLYGLELNQPEICRVESPLLRQVSEDHWVACHFIKEKQELDQKCEIEIT